MKTLKALGLAIATLTAAQASGVYAEQTLNIGFTGPLSGGAALYGENTLSGLRMAVEDTNEAGGIKIGDETYKVNLISLDDKYSPSQAATNAKRLVKESKAAAVFVPHTGGVFALQDFNVADDFLIMAYTSVPSVTEQGNPLTVRIPPEFTGYVDAFSDYALKHYGKKLGIAGATHEYAKIWTDMMTKAWEEKGGEIVESNPMDYNKSTDFYTGVSRVIASNPDVMFVGGASEPTGLVMQQARQLGFPGGFIVMDQAKLDEIAAVTGGLDLLEGAIGVVPLSEYEGEAAKAFVERYKEAHGKVPGSEAAYNYLAFHALAKAMELAGSTDPQQVRAKMAEAISALDPKYNLYSIQGLTDKGGFITPTTMAVVEGGKIVRKEIK
ncbi:ABC transporter substrate-binding protein [Stutzerimonas xanthomarina]|uniref:Amino acid/amide ABC transporter substrate-binding protein, HAAT family n=2 Tax=Stutzerimonas xanthomarina TaxID=271420 RepID=A0A1M5KHI5_9GAMM|nr:ABC transporter substrate-binding protein [Stutzerimonas xanthomarina]MCP9337108.1 ABC transporter substrate-binding protein [Stutzerimonas xanthomarina]SEI06423.1 branched-chain amino acid transport system substrate-binding protein [Stutzerimonas xanthomarina]SHG51939.1 amino acid/amide ABC transporter substrate-binding protein, HAAT family [Stutzerimonas xanthomarina DSM 18231]